MLLWNKDQLPGSVFTPWLQQQNGMLVRSRLPMEGKEVGANKENGKKCQEKNAVA